MTKTPASRKQLSWQKRLKRFRSRGQTVARFCQLEKVTPSAFYYWSRRMREAGAEPAVSPVSPRRRRRHTESDLLVQSVAKISRPTTGDTGPAPTAPPVHIVWNQDLQVSIPADCLDAIRTVLEWCREGATESPLVTEQSSPFHQVLANAR